MKFFPKFNDKVAVIFVYVLVGLLGITGTASARKGNWVDFASQLAVAFFITIVAHNASIYHKLDERFDRLEKLLCKQSQDKKEQKVIGQNTDKSLGI